MKRLTALSMLCAAIACAVAAGADDGAPAWKKAAPGYAWSFPRDLAVHPDYSTEWWYVTGNVTDDATGEDLAFQLTFFRVGLSPAGAPDLESDWATADVLMAHASVVDPAHGGHVFSETLWRTSPQLGGFGAPGDSVLAWCRAPAGGAGEWRLSWDGEAFRMVVRDDTKGLRYDLVCRPTRAPVFHGEGGFSRKNASGTAASLYFSHPRMVVDGTIGRGGRDAPVSGLAWLDREIFSSTLAEDQVGWDWLSLQLEDGRDLMIYQLRGRDGAADYASGTLVEADGTVLPLSAADWTWEPTGTWHSEASGADYPVRSRLRVPGAGIDVELAPLVDAQENVSRVSGVRYWEGAVRAVGAGGEVLGKGFVELTGYGEGNRPPV